MEATEKEPLNVEGEPTVPESGLEARFVPNTLPKPALNSLPAAAITLIPIVEDAGDRLLVKDPNKK